MTLSPVARGFLAALAATSTLSAPALQAAGLAPTITRPPTDKPVTITQDAENFTMDNGIVKAVISKRKGNMTSIFYHGMSIGGRGGIWESTPGGQVTDTVTIDPASTNGDRGEVSVKGPGGNMDIELRYTLERGSSGFYTYGIYNHPANYPQAGFGENRFIIEGTPINDWISVDADRNMPMCNNYDLSQGVVVHAKEQRILSTGIYKNSVEHKYSYCAVMYRTPAWGMSSIEKHIGLFFMNPSNEYIDGGSEKLDLVAHMTGTILDYWTSGHYAGGANTSVPAGEQWNKVVGPIFIYINALDNAQQATQADLDKLKATEGNPVIPAAWTNNATALWQDAVQRAAVEKAKWPYTWVTRADYPQKNQRSTVTGQFVLNDPQAATPSLPNLTVGLAHADYQGNGSQFQLRAGNGNTVTWAHDGNYYQFWANGNDNGTFTIPNVRAGKYTLHAFANGVLGEYAQTNITVEPGKPLNLGQLNWKPVRYGKQLWEIGYPDRTGDKFFKGDGANYWRWGWCMRYALLFPNDITYTIGKSDYHKDWFFEEVPHSTNLSWVNPEAKDPANQPFGWVKAESLQQYQQSDERGPWRVYGTGRATTWTVKFTMPKAAMGTATLRVALAGAAGIPLAIGVNGKPAGTIQCVGTDALRYNTNKGVWREYTLAFDATQLKWGENTMEFTVPAGDLTSGVVWDYLRLELDQTHPFNGAVAMQ